MLRLLVWIFAVLLSNQYVEGSVFNSELFPTVNQSTLSNDFSVNSIHFSTSKIGLMNSNYVVWILWIRTQTPNLEYVEHIDRPIRRRRLSDFEVLNCLCSMCNICKWLKPKRDTLNRIQNFNLAFVLYIPNVPNDLLNSFPLFCCALLHGFPLISDRWNR